MLKNRKRRLPIVEPFWLLRIRIVPPEAVAAMHRAGPGQHQQRATFVLVQEARSFPITRLVERVVREAGGIFVFLCERQHLSQQWIVDVTRPHPSQETLRNQHRKFAALFDPRQARLERLQSESRQQLERIANRLGQRIPPIVRHMSQNRV